MKKMEIFAKKYLESKTDYATIVTETFFKT